MNDIYTVNTLLKLYVEKFNPSLVDYNKFVAVVNKADKDTFSLLVALILKK